ncbi:MAG: hypothetical protein PHI68_00305, partial [Candidatus Cloacimonetes bacterium]|nr:hypothetical protein [Candidatus Cloacimonadota bacterium]
YQNPAQIAMLIEKLDTGRADYLVTTEKDASKLQRYPELINRIAIAGLELIFAQEEDFSRALISRLGRPDA